MNNPNTPAIVDPGLARALILKNHPKQRISNEASEAIAELIRLFVLEGRNRALVEAECEIESKLDNVHTGGEISIEGHHITKIAAELLLDL